MPNGQAVCLASCRGGGAAWRHRPWPGQHRRTRPGLSGCRGRCLCGAHGTDRIRAVTALKSGFAYSVQALWANVNGLRAVLFALLTLAFILVFAHAGFFISSFVLLVVIMRFVEGLP